MCKSGLAWLLVARTYFVVDIDEGLRRGAIDMQQYGQAIVENVAFVGDVDACEVLCRSRQNQQGGKQRGRCESFDHL